MSTAAKGGAFRTRALTALVGIPLGLLFVCLGAWPLLAAVALLTVLGLHEFYRLTRVTRRFDQVLGDAFGLTVLVAAFTLRDYYLVGVGLAALLALAHFVAALVARSRPDIHSGVRRLAAVLGGLLYVAFFFGFLLQLRDFEALRRLPPWLPPGALWLFLVIACCWVIDTAAYLVGRAIGRHKLAPAISPGKTIEGGLAGLAAAVLWTLVVGLLLGLSAGVAALLGLVLGVGDQVGDLFESLLKRRAGVKDAGALLPGHGGVLDRFDSLLFCAPLAFAFLCALMR